MTLPSACRPAKCAPGTAALTDSARRVQVMARIHNRLYGSTNLAHVEFDIFVRSLAEEVLSSHSKDQTTILTKFDTDAVVLALEQAIPCSQIVSELISNSIKHAFPRGKSGIISISLHADNNAIELSVADDGIGVPEEFDWNGSQNLGLQMIHALASQLNAEFALERRNGTHGRLTFDREFGNDEENINR